MTDAGAKSRLRRALGFRDVVSFYVVAIVGLRWIATAAAVGPSAIVLWLVALATFFLPLAFAVIELSSRHPEEGGIYAWTRRAFGDFAGFLTGWMYWASNLVYMPGLLYFSAASALFVVGERGRGLAQNPAYFLTWALGGMALALILNLVGLRVGKWLSNAGAIGTWVPAAALVGLGAVAAMKFGSASSFSLGALVPSAGFRDVAFWSTVAFAFAGFEAASLMGEEIVDARRTVPRAIVVAGVIIAAIYILGTIAILVALPREQVTGLAGIPEAVDRVASRLGAGAIMPVVALLLALGGLGGTSAWLGSTARLPFVAGLDRFLPAAFGRLHPRWGTPHVSLWTQAVAAAAIAVLGQAGSGVKAAYDALVSMGVIVYFVPYLLLFGAWMRVQKEPAGEGVVRLPGGRPAVYALATLGMATTLASIGFALVPPADAPHPAWAALKVAGGSLLLTLLGVAVYGLGSARRRRA